MNRIEIANNNEDERLDTICDEDDDYFGDMDMMDDSSEDEYKDDLLGMEVLFWSKKRWRSISSPTTMTTRTTLRPSITIIWLTDSPILRHRHRAS